MKKHIDSSVCLSRSHTNRPSRESNILFNLVEKPLLWYYHGSKRFYNHAMSGPHVLPINWHHLQGIYGAMFCKFACCVDALPPLVTLLVM